MKILPQRLPDVHMVWPARFPDARGFFSETYNADEFRRAGLETCFVQDNHSLSVSAGTVRGLHYQLPPFAQAKLIRVVRGAIFDVAVDIRRGSPTFGQHVAAVLSADEWNQMLIPAGFAHGFCTIAPDTEVSYKCSAVYSRDHERGIFWRDPALGIAWPVTAADAVISDKDRQLPFVADAVDLF